MHKSPFSFTATTPEAVRAAIAQTVQVSAEHFADDVGPVVLTTSDQVDREGIGPEVMSFYDSREGVLTLLTDHIPLGSEAEAFVAALLKFHSFEKVDKLVGPTLAAEARAAQKISSIRDQPGIEVVLTRQAYETGREFKVRCSNMLKNIEPAPGTFSTGRCTPRPDGWLTNDIEWGLFFGDEPTSDTCVITSFNGLTTSKHTTYSVDTLAMAPLNPDLVAETASLEPGRLCNWDFVIRGDGIHFGVQVQAVDPRDALSRALTSKAPNGNLVGEQFGVPIDVLSHAPANFDTNFSVGAGRLVMTVQRNPYALPHFGPAVLIQPPAADGGVLDAKLQSQIEESPTP